MKSYRKSNNKMVVTHRPMKTCGAWK